LVRPASVDLRSSAARMRAFHHDRSTIALGSRSSSLSDISDRGLHNATPRGFPRWSCTSTTPAPESGGETTSLLKIHG
jgi:hypothetical protein